MKTCLRSFLLLAAAVPLLGMGGLGGRPQGTAPKPEENIRALIVDRAGVRTEVRQFSLEGNVFLDGRRGDGQMTVFFKNLRGITFGRVEGEVVSAELHYNNGETLRLNVRKRRVFYGDTRYGTFQIRAGNIRKIEFSPLPSQG
jgi:hypothetical protein